MLLFDDYKIKMARKPEKKQKQQVKPRKVKDEKEIKGKTGTAMELR